MPTRSANRPNPLNVEVKDLLHGRLASVPPSSFARLAELLKDIVPSAAAPVVMTVGEPQDAPPPFIAEIVNARARDFGRYPPIAGTPSFRAACASWLARRFHLPASSIDPDTQILPLNGSREGLFFGVFPLMRETKGGGRPVVLIPNPFYSVYPAAVIAAGAEPYYVASRPSSGFLPDFSTVPQSVLERTVAAFFCSPSNPEGACATTADWQRLFGLADTYDFTVLADECYCEIYDRAPPPGAAEVRYAMTGGYSRLLSFHSLSKRSNVPGLRSGFVFGAPDLIRPLFEFRNTAAPQVPLPVLEASCAAWADETHVEATRALYRTHFEIAERLLGNAAGFRRPKGAFYLWLDVGNGAQFARRLWRTSGVKVMPGAFMGVETVPGDPASNPGYAYVRVALVHDSLTITTALERLRKELDAGA